MHFPQVGLLEYFFPRLALPTSSRVRRGCGLSATRNTYLKHLCPVELSFPSKLMVKALFGEVKGAVYVFAVLVVAGWHASKSFFFQYYCAALVRLFTNSREYML